MKASCRALLIGAFVWILLFSLPITVSADCGPKPQLTIIVDNPPEEEYFLDLLVHETGTSVNYLNKDTVYEPQKLELLKHYSQDGWYPGFVHGTSLPMFGDLVGVKSGNTMVHTFGYVGLPDDYKIIIVTPEKNIVVSEPLHKDTFQETIHYDYKTGKVTQNILAVNLLFQFISTLIPTLLIEGLVLLLFGFSLRLNWIPFLSINVITQIFLTLTLGVALLTSGTFYAYLIFVPMEIIIILVERFAFMRYLKQHSERRRGWYAVTANLLSAAAGLVLINFDFMKFFGLK
jgi:hypothetical protein